MLHWSIPIAGVGGQGVHHEVKFGRFEEKCRAVIKEATLQMNQSVKDGGKIESAVGGGVLVHPSNQGVCADGTVRKINA